MLNLLYISSTVYSGSTLLSFLLGSHPEIATVGEPPLGIHEKKYVSNSYKCSCGSVIRDCSFWNEVSDEMAKQGFEFDVVGFDLTFDIVRESSILNRFLVGSLKSNSLEGVRDCFFSLFPAYRRRMENQCEKNRAFVESVINVTKKKCFVDATKSPMRIRYLAKIPGINLKVIDLIRDGRAFINSFINSRAGSYELRAKMNESWVAKTTEIAADHWCYTYSTAKRMSRLIPPGNYIQIRYEDLCGNPDEYLKKLFKFAGVDQTVKIRDFRSVDHHILGNVMRLDNSNSEIRVNTKWHDQLGSIELKVFEKIAGKMNREFGYE